MSIVWFSVAVFFLAGSGCGWLANRLFATIVLQVKNADSTWDPGTFIFFWPWTGPEIMRRHRWLYPNVRLRFYCYACGAAMLFFMVIAGILMPTRR